MGIHNNLRLVKMVIELSSTKGELTPDDVMQIAIGFQRSRILLTAYELGLFSALADEEKTSADVADELGTDARATDRLMNALCVMGLLEKNEDLFSNTPSAAELLAEGKPGYMAGLMHTVHLWDTWSTLTDAVRAGGSVAMGPVNERGDKWLDAFISAMHYRGTRQAEEVVSQLDLDGVTRVLDVGGGSGAFAMAFARAREGLRATVFDLPSVIPLTVKYLEAEGYSDRVDTAVGDYHADDFGDGYDVVFLSAIIHSNSFDENRGLIKKAADALNPGGQVVVSDFIVDEDRTGPPRAAVFALNMLVATEAGDTYTESEVRDMMGQAGLTDITRKDVDFASSMMIGRKPR
jgi:2-polyprenyl-3-methyl-5-hydroxy-6-metoxy-1,4-benzoquinol methylase